MAKPDPALLQPARYPFHCRIATRFGDLDVNRHLNNVAMVGILEDARVRFYDRSGFTAAHGTMTTMVASFTVEYLGQAWYPQPLDMYVAVARVGRTSCTLQQLVQQEDRIISFAQAVLVCMVDDQPTAPSAAFFAGLADWLLRP